jgi:hypothetical protein
MHIMNELIAVITTNFDAIISFIIHYPTIAIPMMVVTVFLIAAFKN